MNQSFLLDEDGADGAGDELLLEDDPPLSGDEEVDPPDLESPLLLLSLEPPSLFDDEPSLLLSDRFEVSGLVFEPAAPPLP